VELSSRLADGDGSNRAETIVDDEDSEARSSARCCGTRNLRVLWLILVLNTSFAVAQMVGASLANSLSMFSDSGSMLVDSISYLANIVMENAKNKYGKEASKGKEALTSLFSVILLLIVTGLAIGGATERLNEPDASSETVDGGFVMGFSLGNLFIDIVMCASYILQVRHKIVRADKEVLTKARDELNMVTAFTHLFADTLRTITGVVAGALELQVDADAAQIDSVATYIVCSLILFAALFVVYEALQLYSEYRSQVRYEQRSRVGIGESNAQESNETELGLCTINRDLIRNIQH